MVSPPPQSGATQSTLVEACFSPAAKAVSYVLIALCILEALVFMGLAQRLSKRNRSFHTFAYCLMLIPPIGYTAMLSGFGIEEFGAPASDRCFFTGRWTMLLLEVPLLVTTAGLLAGVVAFDLSVIAISSFLSITCGLLGGLITTDTRWLMFALSALFAMPVLRSCWNRFNLKEGDLTGYDHEYASIISSRLGFLCTCLITYLTVTLVFWVLCQGANVMRSATELVVLGIVDLLMTSVFCVGLLSDRESIEKMSELNSRSMGWLRTGGGTTDYSSIEERGTVGAGGSKFSGAHA